MSSHLEVPLASFPCQRDTSLSNCVGVSCKNKGRKLVGPLAMSNKGEPMLLIFYKRACCKQCLATLHLFASFEHVHKNNLCAINCLCHSEPPLNGMHATYGIAWGHESAWRLETGWAKCEEALNMETCSMQFQCLVWHTQIIIWAFWSTHLDSQASSPCQNLQSGESRDTPITSFLLGN